MPDMKEVVADTACGSACINRNLRRVIRTGVNGSTLVGVCNSVSVEHSPSPVLIGIFATSPPCGLSGRLKVAKKRRPTSPGLGGNTQKLDAVVDGKLPNDLDSASIFSKVIGHKLSKGSSGDLYLRCRTNFANDPVQIQAPHFIGMGLPAIKTLNESSLLSTPATRI